MEQQGRNVIILVEEIFNDQEFWYPYYRLKEAGAKVVVVGSAMQVYTGKAGTQVKPDVTAETISAADFDGVVIPGGYAPDHMRRNPAMVKLVRDLFEGGKVVAAICHAAWMLASAKILQGRTVTSFYAIKDDLIHAGAHYVDQEVAGWQADHQLQARGPTSFHESCLGSSLRLIGSRKRIIQIFLGRPCVSSMKQLT